MELYIDVLYIFFILNNFQFYLHNKYTQMNKIIPRVPKNKVLLLYISMYLFTEIINNKSRWMVKVCP